MRSPECGYKSQLWQMDREDTQKAVGQERPQTWPLVLSQNKREAVSTRLSAMQGRNKAYKFKSPAKKEQNRVKQVYT